jgi:hypothetical protein
MGTKIVTGVCRLSYEHIFDPSAMEGQEPKYSAQIIIPKSDTKTIEAIKMAAIDEAKKQWLVAMPQNLKMPLKDGDGMLDKTGKQRQETVGAMVVNASSKTRPGVVDANRQDIIDRSMVYSGCYCRFQITIAAYSRPTSKGVTAFLNNVQLVKEGPSLSGGDSAADAFNDGATFVEQW